MIKEEEIKKAVIRFNEVIYAMYLKDLKSGNISKDKNLKSFGKICKKRASFKSNEEPNLFSY